LKITALTNVGS